MYASSDVLFPSHGVRERAHSNRCPMARPLRLDGRAGSGVDGNDEPFVRWIAAGRRAGRGAAARAQVPARTRGRRRRRADLRRRVRAVAARGEAADLAPLRGRARGPRHLLRPALRAQPRDARRARGDPHAPGGDRPGDARRDRALHEAVLDQHRPVQQPDGAQVRAQVRARGVRRRRAGRRRGRRALPAEAPASRSTRCSRACSRSSST